MTSLALRVSLFIFFSIAQVRIVDAKDYRIPAEEPKDCVKIQILPCAVSTGDRPRMFKWEKQVSFELDRNLVLETRNAEIWNIYQGMAVIDSKKPVTLHTPFADIFLEASKVMIHVLENRVRVLSLAGQGVKVRGKGSQEENYLVPGFQNWYGSVDEGETESGVASVIDFDIFAKQRAKFFLNHEYGFLRELQDTAKTVKWAAQKAAQMHRDLVERKMASLEEKHQEKILKKRRKIQFNKYLRRLFLQKVRYDY